MEIIISNNQEKVSIEPELFKKTESIIKRILEKHNILNSEVSVLLVDDSFITKLNKDYRDRNEPTDVLSFPMDDDDSWESLLGDIVISMEAVVRQSQEYRHSKERELCYLVVHGMLHLLGYSHDNEGEKGDMRCLEEEVLNSFELGCKDDD